LGGDPPSGETSIEDSTSKEEAVTGTKGCIASESGEGASGPGGEARDSVIYRV
jgi:hypothetical protein